MNQINTRIIAGVAVVCLGAVLHCRADGIGIAGKIGTLGWGGDLTIGWGEQVNLRGGVNGIHLTKQDSEINEAQMMAALSLETYPILLDWHPGGSGFRLSAGIVVNNNELRAGTDERITMELNDRSFSLDEFRGKISFDRMAYFAGIGFGNAARKPRINMLLDIGVMFHGKPEVKASATATDSWAQSMVDQALEAEIAELKADLKSFTWYPVVAIGFSISF